MVMVLPQKYPLKDPLPPIERHDQLPPDAEVLVSCFDAARDDLYTFTKRNHHLSILKSCTLPLKTGPKYCCWQYDFPLRALSWFPRALEEFRKPPAQGGLPAGVMIGQDEDVDGEMLAVGNTSEGYDLTNWSRKDPSYKQLYRPMQLLLSWHLLYRVGLLDLWKQLGEKYERGTL